MKREIQTLASPWEVRCTLGWLTTFGEEETGEFKPVLFFAIPQTHDHGSTIVSNDYKTFSMQGVTASNDTWGYHVDETAAEETTMNDLALLSEEELVAWFKERGVAE